MKKYKGWELFKGIAEGSIQKEDEFTDSHGDTYYYSGLNFKNDDNSGLFITDNYNDIDLAKETFTKENM